MSGRLTVIIPVYNLIRRGLDRVRLSVLSLSGNTIVPEIIVVDGSSDSNYRLLGRLLNDFPRVRHLHLPQERYNMPMLFNGGIEAARTPFLLCTGADFLYRRDFVETLMRETDERAFIMCKVRSLPPRAVITEQMVRDWNLPPSKPNGWGNWADGVQCFHRWWYDYAGGYDERMFGWGGMDNDHHFRADRYGLACKWLEASEVLHIWHKSEKVTGKDAEEKRRQSHANWHLRDTDKTVRRNVTIPTADVTIVVPSYNRPASLCRLVQSLQQDAVGLRVTCLLFDDRSDVKYDLPSGSDRFKIRRMCLLEHHGKTRFWKLVDAMLKELKSTSSPYVIMLPDDVAARPGFFDDALGTYDAIGDESGIALTLTLDEKRMGRPNWTTMLPRIERHGDRSVFRIGWVDYPFLAERKLLEALDYRMEEVPSYRWKGDARLSSGVGLQLTRRLKAFALYQVRRSFLESTGEKSLMWPGSGSIDCTLDPIVCTVDSVPEQVDKLRQTVESVLPFVDQVHVILNGFADVPAFLSHPKVTVRESRKFDDGAYHIAVENGFEPPPELIWKLVNALRSRQGKRHQSLEDPVVALDNRVIAFHTSEQPWPVQT